ncbi:hypothetical protein [Aestuariibius sp. HNIBRBA575]|uniref:hypothetical protein n=1 Tax=Aestuariibius sp. HNIBRBA575 TaxID=3233343 RepID=UPI0034A4C029
MTRHLFLHIGMPKSGSTYLQRVLLQNQATLAAAGISYPHDSPGQGHPGNGRDIGTCDTAQLEALFDGHDRMILSHEDLYTQGEGAVGLRQAAKNLGVAIHIQAFVRPFSEFAFGDYSQSMKQNFRIFLKNRSPYMGRSFEQYTAMRGRTLNPVLRFRQWQSSLPEAQIAVDSHKDIRPVVETYLTRFGDLPTLNWHLPKYLTNPSLRTQDCDDLARMIANKHISEDYIEAHRRAVMHETGKPDAGRTKERITWLEAMCEHRNAELWVEYGYDNRLPDAKGTDWGVVLPAKLPAPDVYHSEE